jgi:uncharacterized membrane protein
MKSRLSIALLWILVFLMGGIAGAVSHYLYWEHFKKPPDIVEGMARELKLDALQKESLETIFEQSRKRYWALAQQFRPQYETIRNETDEQIKNILRADQRKRFEEFLKKVYSAPPSPRRQTTRK